MDFHELEAFVTLAKTLHFAKAANAIHTSPSALSRLLGRLEDELGARLLERDTRQVSLTEQGQAFLEFASDSLRRRDELHLQLNSRDGQLQGILRVFASVTACYSILPPLVAAISAAHAQLRLSVDTGDPADAETAMLEGRVDLALGALPDGGLVGLDCFSVRQSPLVFVASRQGAFGSIQFDPQGLGELPLILPRKGLARERFDRWIRDKRIRPHIHAETAGNEAVLALARLGLGLGLVPRIVLENSPFAEGLVVYQAGADFGHYDIGFLLSSARSNSNSALRNALRELLGRVYPKGSWIKQ